MRRTLPLLIALNLFAGWGYSEDVVSFARNVVIQPGQSAIDVVCILCSAEVAGEVSGDVVTIGGDAVITGKVAGDVVASGGKIQIGDQGRVGGDSVAVGGTVSSPDGRTDGSVDAFPYFHFPGQRSFHPQGLLSFFLFFTLICGLGLLLGTTRLERFAERLSRRWRLSFVFGGVAWTVLLIIFFGDLLGSSLVSTLLGWLLVLLWFAALAVGFLGIASYVGFRVLKQPGRPAFISGVAAMSLPLLVPVAGAGVAAMALLASLGAGIQAVLPDGLRAQFRPE
jgi:hypothetical protein